MIRWFALPLAQPLQTARGEVAHREGFLFQRASGVGEATPMSGWTETLRACEEALGDAERADNWQNALDACGAAPAARHAVSLARLDAVARDADESLAATLADGEPADSVPVNATIGDASVGQTADAAKHAEAEGFETVKLKVGARDVADDVERVEAVLDATDLSVRVDANGAWTREQAHDACFALGHLGVEYVEQPLPAHDLAGHADLRGSVDVALDESLTEYPVGDVLTAADAVVLKPMVLGGVDSARRAATAARDAGVEPVVTTTVDGVVARTAAVHLAASIPSVSACGLATADFLETDLAADPAPVEDGQVRVPDGPGHGVDVPRGQLPGGSGDA